MFVIDILVDLPIRQQYSYRYQTELAIGSRVLVEFRNKHQIGFVIASRLEAEFKAYPLDKLNFILQVYPEAYTISPHIIELSKFTASYYHHPLGNTLFTATPTLLRKEIDLIAPTNNSQNKYYQILNLPSKIRSVKQQECLRQLTTGKLNFQLIKKMLGTSAAKVINHWLCTGVIQEITAPPASEAVAPLTLNSEQNDIVEEITKQLNCYHPALLYGITGSGKTEVFLQLITKVLAIGQQILVLVPEINLTPQLASRFSSRFPYTNIVILNSEISDKQRLSGWLQAKVGTAHIILGTRLGVFTPFKALGLIIIDEEHDRSFKQNDGLRYHARDLAVWRAHQLQIPIILASATPSLETLYNYKQKRYNLYKLTVRANSSASLPKINLLNLQHYPVNHAGISQIAIQELENCLKRQELALIFINRRGYAPVVTCYECGWVSSCRYCSSKMVYHHNQKLLQCHHCSYHIPVPAECPSCHNQYIHTIGHGTQKLEQFLCERFPIAQLRRVDRDSVNSKKAWQNLYTEIDNDQVDILVGTQMLAKGHDFANLTLVIGLNLDNALYSYDFRASEDMFNTLTQVAGRAGRAGKPGTVILQTNFPEHPLYEFLKKHDFNGFINYTLAERRQNQLPPYSYYALVRLSDHSENKLKEAMQKLHKLSKAIPHSGLTLYPPVMAVMPKLHNRYRGQMLITAKTRQILHNYLLSLETQLSALNIALAIDVDPFEL